nr:immunoglobulin heavy chain junction region [Macaca mulatta]MOW47529.1 immunoglobulin heavy chain junction region [Macaca mulatta]MOW50150.1 immunoglobulin heavy chain junction region [Macaca mulatta]
CARGQRLEQHDEGANSLDVW